MSTTPASSLASLRIDRTAAPRRRVWPLLLLLLLLAALVAGGVWWFRQPRAAEVRSVAVREVVDEGPGRTLLNATGYLVARREATVSSKVTGKVIEVMVSEGMAAAEGQVLAKLEDTNLQTALRLAEAQVASVRSARKETDVRLQEAERNRKRSEVLADKGIASAAERDTAESECRALAARLERQELEVTVADRQVEQLRQQLDDLVIRAPFAGIVTAKSAQPGEMISPVSAGGGYTRTGICTITDMSSLEIEVDVSERFISRVQPRQPVVAVLDAYPDWEVPAKVITVIPTADRQKATVKVRIGIDQLDPRMLPQMGVKVAFRGGEGGAEPAAGAAAARRVTLAVPRAAVRRQSGQEVAFVVANGRVERRAVTVQEAGADEYRVEAGLMAGERVVIEGPESLQDGARVRERR